ncbi:sulfite exporter TauE/SafE family protein [Aliifodinibius sp. S!AR15-10]|uniref:sulfite exporter TauE/SafE family protein n=1 Tax=Aliifodinibius sp. S!AR15-10 TaxID=2950437 RepID=UPI00285ABE28|nr:sulfite exporter TauE/SafE family protein [Aliifodinibius sp. S!AR15-10]MDR8393427.1 sulfite exporter TauE/SafE family protein [Aliifodinibius sp. S!AR15-10]
MELWTAFTIGLFGSFHCVGMCGPLAMALPGSGNGVVPDLIQKSIYNLGRILTYSLLGAIIGLAGHAVSLAGLQRPLSVLLGMLIIAGAFLPMISSASKQRFEPLQHFFTWLKQKLKQQLNRKGKGMMLIIGVLNGLLPCGFVYVGLASSLTTGSIVGGMSYMALFGLGTFPAMMLMAMAPNLISLNARRRINRYLPFMALLLGCYLVYRGLMMANI